jgi:hypothetical protein
MSQNAVLNAIGKLGYNHAMPTIQRPDRVNIKVSKRAKRLALLIAHVMTNAEDRWKETDAWEQGVVLLATRKDIKEKLESLTESQIIEILKPLTKQDAPKEVS